MEDPSISWVLIEKERNAPRPDWTDVSPTSPVTKAYWLQWDKLIVIDEVLYRKWESNSGHQIMWKLVLPEGFRKKIVNELHGGKMSGHLGLRKTMGQVRQRFYWSGMSADIGSIVRQCDVCASKKSPAKKRRAPLQQYTV